MVELCEEIKTSGELCGLPKDHPGDHDFIEQKRKKNSPAHYKALGQIRDNLRIAPIVIREVGNDWANFYLRDVSYLMGLLDAKSVEKKEEPTAETQNGKST